jgi:hypothetical protein
VHLGRLVQVQGLGDLGRCGDHVEREDGRARSLARRLQVLEQAAQLDRSPYLGLDDGRPDAATPDEQPLIHQVLHRLAHGGTREPQVAGELELVVEAAAGRQLALLDRSLQPQGDLEVQRDGAVAIDRNKVGELGSGDGHRSADHGTSMTW